MTGYVLSPQAQADIDESWDYIEQRWNTAQAERYIRLLQQGIEFVAGDQRRGYACDDIRVGYRKYGVGKHTMFYRLTGSGIDVVRILHGSMDFDRHL